jgi:hypothetical protein
LGGVHPFGDLLLHEAGLGACFDDFGQQREGLIWTLMPMSACKDPGQPTR